MFNPFKRKKPDVGDQIRAEVDRALAHYKANESFADTQSLRGKIAAAVSGGYDFADTLHNVYLDYGYPETLEFFHFWNMYRRFGIAASVAELPVDIGWVDEPEILASEQFRREFDSLATRLQLWTRLKGLDRRQRVGRYAGLFMRVKDGKAPSEPLEGKLPGATALVQVVPLYEGQLKVLNTDNDPTSETFGLPTMYQFNGGEVGNRNEKEANSFNIHPSRIVIAAEGADNGDIYGISSLEASYNSLMDLRKIIGAGGEGFYKNAAQSVVFELNDASKATANAALLDKFNTEFDAFSHDRFRRAMWTPGLTPKTLESSLANPKDFFTNALNDVAAASKIPATILIGQQTGRLASDNDSRHFLSMLNSRRKNFQTDLVMATLEWCMKWGILPRSPIELEWSDLLASSDEERLANAAKMATINKDQFSSGGGTTFTDDEIREAAGFESMEEIEPGSEDLPDEGDEEND